ncbi:hypothetical protein Acr_00g0046330 [Actinidia rufa]|uniref:Integrase-type DNA-binding superfamily protein n=1 Tax=Actinidia rufa TaxID=165716 RepID=A0A7J0DLA7_9ERIC|nr:hypothetical protein Acr_00g0046330 [Actinidia rufa]
MDLGPTSTPQKGRQRRGEGPYAGVRLREGARAYDAALYCLKGEHGSFNFPNNRRLYLANRSVGALPVDEIQCIAAEFSCFDDSAATSEPFPMSPLMETHLLPEPPVTRDPQNVNEMEANNVDTEPYFPAFMQEEEPYVPTLSQRNHISQLMCQKQPPCYMEIYSWTSGSP